jgi:hypothetical protein
MNQCDHISKVIKWGFDKNHDFKATLWGCTNCEATSKKPFKTTEAFVDHSKCDYDPCFGCKAKGLQLSTGDAAGNKAMPAKKWNKELNMYREARRQGIQPAGTTEKAVRDALEKSDKAGKAYNANVSG